MARGSTLILVTAVSAIAMGQHSRSISRLMEVLQFASRLEKSPGFSNYLGLTTEFYAGRSAKELSFDANTLDLRIPITSQICFPKQNQVSLSTYMAILDDATTWALVLGDKKRGRAGVSVSLGGEWGQAARKAPDEVDIQATVSKIGRNMGFVQATIKDTCTGELICHGSHIKYLPMGFVMDFAQSSSGRPFARWLAKHFLNDKPMLAMRPLDSLFDSFCMQSDTQATFVIAPEHASLGGPIHGGCQMMLMELAATETLKRTHPNVNAELESATIEYIASPGENSAEISVEILPCSTSYPTIVAQVCLNSRGRTSSIGKLRFSYQEGDIHMHSKL